MGFNSIHLPQSVLERTARDAAFEARSATLAVAEAERRKHHNHKLRELRDRARTTERVARSLAGALSSRAR